LRRVSSHGVGVGRASAVVQGFVVYMCIIVFVRVIRVVALVVVKVFRDERLQLCSVRL
jgi:hypothetical protein